MASTGELMAEAVQRVVELVDALEVAVGGTDG